MTQKVVNSCNATKLNNYKHFIPKYLQSTYIHTYTGHHMTTAITQYNVMRTVH